MVLGNPTTSPEPEASDSECEDLPPLVADGYCSVLDSDSEPGDCSDDGYCSKDVASFELYAESSDGDSETGEEPEDARA